MLIATISRNGAVVETRELSGAVTVGGAADCDVRLSDPQAARIKFRIVVRIGEVLVEDLGSDRSIAVSSPRDMLGTVAHPSARVAPGDVIRAHPYVIRIDGDWLAARSRDVVLGTVFGSDARSVDAVFVLRTDSQGVNGRGGFFVIEKHEAFALSLRTGRIEARRVELGASHILDAGPRTYASRPRDVTIGHIAAAPLPARATIAFRTAAAVDVRDCVCFVAEDGCLVARDEDGVERGRLDLECGAKKDAHDVLVRGSRAYLLDNYELPALVFVVDVAEPAQMRVIARTDLSGIGAHLSAQWLDPAADRWWVVRSTSHRSGSSKAAIALTLAGVPVRGVHIPMDGANSVFAISRGARPFGLGGAPNGVRLMRLDAAGMRFAAVAGPELAIEPPEPLKGGECAVELGDGRLLFVHGSAVLVVEPGPPARLVAELRLPLWPDARGAELRAVRAWCL